MERNSEIKDTKEAIVCKVVLLGESGNKIFYNHFT